MPLKNHNKGKTEYADGAGVGERNGDENRESNSKSDLMQCSMPKECLRAEEKISCKDPGTAVKVFCNNEACTQSQWMHAECFDMWEQSVLGYLRSCGRARSWSEKQRLQNLWTKKGYDLAFKACDCKCGKGHIRKDLNYVAPLRFEEVPDKKHKRHKKKNDKPIAIVSRGPPVHGGANENKPPLRLRTCSVSSTGSSPTRSDWESPSSADTPPVTPETPVGLCTDRSQFNFMLNLPQNSASSIFQRRTSLSGFNVLPLQKRNPYHIKMEEDSGSDDTRTFLLSTLGMSTTTSMHCVLCGTNMPIFDNYPLIDGTFFLSPVRYNSSVQAKHHGKTQYVNAICVSCLEGGRDICCRNCRSRWDGSMLQLGAVYSYDIFAAMPCCQRRLTCKKCNHLLANRNQARFFSEFSQSIKCPKCRTEDFHFVRQLSQIFYIKMPI